MEKAHGLAPTWPNHLGTDNLFETYCNLSELFSEKFSVQKQRMLSPQNQVKDFWNILLTLMW
jgi:hypothetical protein